VLNNPRHKKFFQAANHEEEYAECDDGGQNNRVPPLTEVDLLHDIVERREAACGMNQKNMN
jgi:hypothetical protein